MRTKDVKAMVQAIVPFAVTWDGYVEEESKQGEGNVCLDGLVQPVFVALYFAQAAFVAITSNANFGPDRNFSKSSAGFVMLQCVLALLSMYVLILHSLAMPYPRKDQEAFAAQSKLGRTIYLTRHCLEFQAIHQLLSTLSLWYPSLTAATHGMSIWIGSLGMFVTVQFFLLVAPNPGYKKECELWKERGVNFKDLNSLLHVPALFIAVLDVLVVKHGAGLLEYVSMRATCQWVVCYSVLYIGLIVGNYKMTRQWPYMFLNDYGTDLKKWTVFICRQCGILLVFVGINRMMMLLNGYLESMI